MTEENFGTRLRRLRKRKGLTQSMLAEFVGVSLKTVQRWEANERQPRSEEIIKLAQSLNVSEYELLNDTGIQSNGWVLTVKIAHNLKEEVIDLTKSIPRKSSIITTDEGGFLVLGGDYSLWADDSLFKKLIQDMKKLRSTVIQNGIALGGIKQ